MSDQSKPVRLSVDLTPELHRRARLAAVSSGKTLSELVRVWLERFVEHEEKRV